MIICIVQEIPRKHKIRNDWLILLDTIISGHLQMSGCQCIRCNSYMRVWYLVFLSLAFVFRHVMQWHSGICRCWNTVRGQCVCYFGMVKCSWITSPFRAASVTRAAAEDLQSFKHECICELRCDTQVSGGLQQHFLSVTPVSPVPELPSGIWPHSDHMIQQASVWAQWKNLTIIAQQILLNNQINY